MRIINKVISTALAVSFLFACNFCAVESTYASEEHHRSEQSSVNTHHDESKGDYSGSAKLDKKLTPVKI